MSYNLQKTLESALLYLGKEIDRGRVHDYPTLEAESLYNKVLASISELQMQGL